MSTTAPVQVLATHPNVYVLMGTVWVNDTRSIKTAAGTVRDISINFDDPESGDRIFVKYTLWGKHVEDADALKPLIHSRLCTVFTHDQIDWSKPRREFTDKNERPCREYQITDATFHPSGSASVEVDEVAESSTAAPRPQTSTDDQFNPYSGDEEGDGL